MISTLTTFNIKVLAQESDFCDKHKLPYLKSLFDLPNGSRWVGSCHVCLEENKIAELRVMLSKNQQEYKKRIISKLFNRVAIPPAFNECSFANYIDNTKEKSIAKNKMQDFANNITTNLKTGRNVILTGNIGNGKNHLAIATAKVAVENEHTALFTTTKEMIGEINYAGWKNESIIKKYAVPDLLIIDEIKFGLNHIEQEHLSSVMEKRYNFKKSTILISNLSIGNLKEILGARVISRLRNNKCLVVYFTWEDYRK